MFITNGLGAKMSAMELSKEGRLFSTYMVHIYACVCDLAVESKPDAENDEKPIEDLYQALQTYRKEVDSFTWKYTADTIQK